MNLIIWILVSTLCYKLAKYKNRDETLWVILGFLFSLIALLILLCLPRLEGDKID